MSLFKKTADDILALFEKLTEEEKEAIRKKIGGVKTEEAAPDTDPATETASDPTEEDPHAEGDDGPANEESPEAEENGEGASETAAETAEEGTEEAEAEAEGTTAEAAPEPEAVPAGTYMSREDFVKEIEAINAKYDAKLADILALARKGADLADRLNAEEAKAEEAIGYQKVSQGDPGQRETYAELRKRTIGI